MTSDVSRPEGITCADWQPREAGKKRCAFYLPPDASQKEVGAMCNLPTRFLCEEWEKANQALIPDARLAARQKSDPSKVASSTGPETTIPPRPVAQAELFAPPKPEPLTAPSSPPSIVKMDETHITGAPRPYRPAKEIDPQSIEALRALGAEIRLEAKAIPHMELWLVPAYTERADEPNRFEMTYEDAATLRLITDVFPGARLVDLKKKPKGVPTT